MKKLLIVALVFGVVAAFAMPAVALRAPELVTLGPGETFDHAAHVALASDCKQCHHYGVGNGQCDGCHGRTNQAPSLAEAYTACKTCHTSTPASVPAASCSDYSDKDSCRADPDCRWRSRKGVCRDRR